MCRLKATEWCWLADLLVPGLPSLPLVLRVSDHSLPSSTVASRHLAESQHGGSWRRQSVRWVIPSWHVQWITRQNTYCFWICFHHVHSKDGCACKDDRACKCHLGRPWHSLFLISPVFDRWTLSHRKMRLLSILRRVSESIQSQLSYVIRLYQCV